MSGILIAVIFSLVSEISSKILYVSPGSKILPGEDTFFSLEEALSSITNSSIDDENSIVINSTLEVISKLFVFRNTIRFESLVENATIYFIEAGGVHLRESGKIDIKAINLMMAANSTTEPVLEMVNTPALLLNCTNLLLEANFHGSAIQCRNTSSIKIINMKIHNYSEKGSQGIRAIISLIVSEEVKISDLSLESLLLSSSTPLTVANSSKFSLSNIFISGCLADLKDAEEQSSFINIINIYKTQISNISMMNNTFLGGAALFKLAAAVIFIEDLNIYENIVTRGMTIFYIYDTNEYSENNIFFLTGLLVEDNFADLGKVIHYQRFNVNSDTNMYLLNVLLKNNWADITFFIQGRVSLISTSFLILFNNIRKIKQIYPSGPSNNFDSGLVVQDFIYANFKSLSIDYCQSFFETAGLVLSSNQALSSSSIEIQNSSFTNNFADIHFNPRIYGVAITIMNIQTGLISNCYFFNNSLIMTYPLKDRDFFGGPGLIFNTIEGNLSLSACSFIYNRVRFSSAALEFRGFALTIYSSLFYQNMIHNLSSITTESSHGAISASFYHASFDNLTLEGNLGQKGIIFLKNQGSNSLFIGRLLIFRLNVAYTGGCFYLDEKTINRTLKISKSIFTENGGITYSAILYVYIINRVRFHSITFDGCIFLNNTSWTGTIAVIWVYSKSFYSLLNSSVENSNHFYGMLNSFGMENDMEISIENSIFKNISASWAPLFFSTFGILNISNSRIFFIRSSSSGGCFYLVGDVSLNSNFTVIANIISPTGAVIYTYELCSMKLRDMVIFDIFSQNNTIYAAKLVAFSLINVTISNCSTTFSTLLYFTNNSPQVYLTLIGLKISNIENSLFIKTDKTYLSLEDSVVSNFNKLLFLIKDSVIIIKNTSLRGVSCLTEKLACLLYGISSAIQIQNILIARFAAANVLALNLFEKGDITFENIAIYDSNVSYSQFINVLFSDFKIIRVNSTYFYSKFLLVDRSVNVLIEEVIFVGKGNPINSSLVVLLSCQNILIKSSYFSSIESLTTNGSALNIKFLIGKRGLLSIENSTFIENNCNQAVGGAIYIEAASANVTRCIFKRNHALKGGAIYHFCERNTEGNCLLELKNNTFEANVAESAGGAVQSLYTSPKISKDNIYNLNKAPYGNNFASYPWRFAVLVKERSSGEIIFDSRLNTSTEFYFPSHASTKQTSQGIILFPVDGSGEKINEKINMKIEVFLEEKNVSEELVSTRFSQFNKNLYKDDGLAAGEAERRIFGILSALQDNNAEFNFENISLIGCPGCYYVLKFNSSELQYVTSSQRGNISALSKNEFFDDINQKYSILIPLLVRRCEIGEFFLNETNSCESCPEGSYSLQQNQDECLRCPEGAYCEGGTNLALLKGYWRPRENSTLIYECNFQLENCAGGYNSSCSENYEGILCHKCKQTPETFYQKSFTGKCLPCPPLGAVLAVYVGIILVFSAGILFIINILKNPNYSMMAKVLVKIWINYLHFLIIIQTYNLSLSGFSGEIMQVASSLNNMGSFWFSLECLMLQMFGDENVIYQSLISSALLYFEIFAIFGFSYYFSTRWNLNFKLKERIYIIIYILQPAYVDLIFGNLICEEIDGVMRLKSSPGMECWTTTYASWVLFFCIPTFIIWLLVLPYLFYKHVNEYISTIQDLSFKRGSVLAGVRRLSKMLKRGTVCDDGGANSEFLFLGYKNRSKCYTWEFINYFLKMLIILLNQGITNNQLKLHIILFILILFFITESLIVPFSLRVYNALDYMSKVTLMTTCYCLIWTALKIKDGSQYFLFALMIIINLMFVLMSVFLSLKWALEKKKWWPQSFNM